MSTGSTNTIGKYEIIREIARSNDIVYEAIDPSINRRVALKELWIPPNVQGAQRRERIERFRREGKAAGKLAHPNIVTIYEVGQDNDRHFIAMEFLEGQNLREALQAGGPMSINDAIHYALQLCSALSYAHQNGVVHRDIKPDNVQILPGGYCKLTDFGIARLIGESPITQNGQVFGTPSYMSPEQVSGKDIDARSDIFSLGVMLYEMIAGSKPFSGDSIVTVTYNIMNMDPAAPPGAPPWLAGIIRKAMSKDPNDRYASADEMAEDLREQKFTGQYVNGSVFDPTGQSGAYPSPFGGHTHGTAGQGTPYGTSAQPQPASVPDPFARQTPQAPMLPPAPPAPFISSETRNFLGIFLLVIGLTGMLIFAVWAVNLAYKSYQTSLTSEHAGQYMRDADRLHKQGNIEGATEKWRAAIRVSPNSQEAKTAEDNIFKTYVNRAYTTARQGSPDVLEAEAQELIDMRPNAPEGHYYLGYANERRGRKGGAIQEYRKAVEYGGNDRYAIAARDRLTFLGAQTEDAASTAVPPPQPAQDNSAPNANRPRGNNTGIPFDPSE